MAEPIQCKEWSCEHCGRPSIDYALRECEHCGDGMCSTCEDIHDDQAMCPLRALQQSAPKLPPGASESTPRVPALPSRLAQG